MQVKCSPELVKNTFPDKTFSKLKCLDRYLTEVQMSMNFGSRIKGKYEVYEIDIHNLRPKSANPIIPMIISHPERYSQYPENAPLLEVSRRLFGATGDFESQIVEWRHPDSSGSTGHKKEVHECQLKAMPTVEVLRNYINGLDSLNARMTNVDLALTYEGEDRAVEKALLKAGPIIGTVKIY